MSRTRMPSIAKMRAEMVQSLHDDAQAARLAQELAEGGLTNPVLDETIARELGLETLTKEQRESTAWLALALQKAARSAQSDAIGSVLFREIVKMGIYGLRALRKREKKKGTP